MSTIVIDSDQAGFRLKEANMEKINVLAGDIGGTKTNLAVYNGHIGLDAPIAEATYPSKDYPSLEALVQEFLTQFQAEIHLASFGVAGPVANGQATTTNLPWVMDEKELAQRLGFNSVHLLNDLLAFAHAVPFLEDKDVYILNKGKPDAEGAKAVVAPGTGLGEAYLVWDGVGYRAFPSEGGHADFAPRTRLEAGLLRHLWTRFGHVSYERVCSGTGMGRIYSYLKESGFVQEKSWLANELAKAHDPAPVIVQGALDGKTPCEICRKTLDVFVSVLGAEAGNMALRLLATGGVYFGGGIPPRIISALNQESFMQAFQSKGRMSGILEDIPVGVIVNPKAALLGAACHGLNTRRRQSGHTT